MFVFDLPFPPKDVRTCWKHGPSLEHFVSKSKKMMKLRGVCQKRRDASSQGLSLTSSSIGQQMIAHWTFKCPQAHGSHVTVITTIVLGKDRPRMLRLSLKVAEEQGGHTTSK